MNTVSKAKNLIAGHTHTIKLKQAETYDTPRNHVDYFTHLGEIDSLKQDLRVVKAKLKQAEVSDTPQSHVDYFTYLDEIDSLKQDLRVVKAKVDSDIQDTIQDSK